METYPFDSGENHTSGKSEKGKYFKAVLLIAQCNTMVCTKFALLNFLLKIMFIF